MISEVVTHMLMLTWKMTLECEVCNQPITSLDPVCDECALKTGRILHHVDWDQRTTLRPAPFKGPMARLLGGLNIGDARVDALPTSAVCCHGGKARKIGIDSQPEWVDWIKVRRGQEVFMQYLGQIYLALVFALLQGFSIGRFAEVLYYSGYAQSKETAYERYRETAFAIIDWMSYPLDDENSFAHEQLQNVRAMHSFARRRSAKLFDPAKGEGSALSQYDMAEVQLGLSGIALNLLENDFRVKLTDEELDAVCHAWRLVGYHLGIMDDYNACNSLDDMKALVREYMMYVPARFKTCRPVTFDLQRTALQGIGTYIGVGVELFRGCLHASCNNRDWGEDLDYLEEPCSPGMETVGFAMIHMVRNKHVRKVLNYVALYMRDDFLNHPKSARAKKPLFAAISRFNDSVTWPFVGAIVSSFTDTQLRQKGILMVYVACFLMGYLMRKWAMIVIIGLGLTLFFITSSIGKMRSLKA